MSSGIRLPLVDAQRLADELVEILAPVCERIIVAGSIRRKKPDVGDVEIVAIPKIVQREVPGDLFGPAIAEVNELDELCQSLLANGTFAYRLNDESGGKHWGPNLKWGVFKDFGLDVYSANRDTWGLTLLVRTGSGEFSNRIATPRLQLTRNGQKGLSPSHLTIKGPKGDSWRVRRRDTGEALDTPEETDVFDVMGLPWLAPEFRTDDVVLEPLRQI